MEIFLAIDLKEGRCVRLYQGEFSKETVMNEDPVAQAIIFEKLGAEILHIVDLDGAIAGESLNLPVIENLQGGTYSCASGRRNSFTCNGGEVIVSRCRKVILGTAALYDKSF